MESSRKLPRSDLLRARWNACARDHVLSGQKLVVGLSGGLDSVALLHWLSCNVVGEHIRISAMHVHHGLSSNANEWVNHCQALCAEVDVPLSVVRVNVDRASKDGLEGAARRARHAAFSQSDGDWVVLAHHRGDQAETLMFNLLRGSGVRGARSMQQRNGRLLRPWLDIGRDVIEEYARGVGLRWIEDESNADTRFSRNYLRHQVLGPLGERFPAAERNLAAAAARFDEAGLLLDTLARIDLGANSGSFPVSVEVLAALSEPRGRNVLRYLLQSMGVGIPSEERLVEVLRQLIEAAPDRHPRVRFGRWDILRRRGKVLIEPTGNNHEAI